MPPEGDKREKADRGFSRRPTFLWPAALLKEGRKKGRKEERKKEKGPRRSINARRFRFYVARGKFFWGPRNPFRGCVLCLLGMHILGEIGKWKSGSMFLFSIRKIVILVFWDRRSSKSINRKNFFFIGFGFGWMLITLLINRSYLELKSRIF